MRRVDCLVVPGAPAYAPHGSARLGSARLGMDELGGPTLAGKDPVVRRVIAVEKTWRAPAPVNRFTRRPGALA